MNRRERFVFFVYAGYRHRPIRPRFGLCASTATAMGRQAGAYGLRPPTMRPGRRIRGRLNRDN